MIRGFTLGIALTVALAPAVARAQETENPHGEIKDACGSCHTAKGWKAIAIAPSFEHAPRTFLLEGAHGRASCGACHKSLEFAKAPATCASCHQDVHKGELGVTCGSCHTTRSFVDRATMQRAHELTRFPLRGAHMGADCTACHAPAAAGRAQFVNTVTQCVGCHLQDYRKAAAPNHEAAKIGSDCAACHGVSSWLGAGFDHSRSAFPLTGAHIAQTCGACHADKLFTGRSSECVACHQRDYDATKNPPHAGFPTACASCHTTQTFASAKFDHNTDTKFPLTGSHITTTCAGCHGDRVYAGKSQSCISCHQAQYDATANPRHAAAGFSTTCTECHTTATYRGATYDHAKTRFPLTGAHNAVTCAGCHGDQVYRGKAVACGSCHMSDFSATKQPPHAASGFPTTCETCHSSTTTWTGGTFNHATTQFPLTGAHLATTCGDCHSDGVFRGKATSCVSCHQTEFTATTNPHHVPAGFNTACEGCHSTTSFKGARFDHNATSFPLTGAHVARTCLACHADNVYKGKPTSCASCHLTNYNATKNPNHAAVGYSTNCVACHSTTQWLGATFNHNTTAFPLTGSHLAVPCAGCHVNGVYKGTPTACVSCHQTDFNNTTNPHHGPAGFPTTCSSCHTTNPGWKPGAYNHSLTSFPLTGAHLTATCLDCHSDRVYNGKSTTCVSCHLTDYNNTTNPRHASVGFPTDCASCHTTARWLGATFNHDGQFFPIYSGKHKGKWTTCADCHINPANYQTFECILCHKHANKTDVDNKHKQVNGYQYKSTACYACHPTGK